jgi:glucose-1-phosphatase
MGGGSDVVVCFDLGGVLIRIRRTWQQAALAAGVNTALPDNELYPLTDFPLFDAYQLGALDDREYLRELGCYLGIKSEDKARAVHLAILDGTYGGAEKLLDDIERAGMGTACLSNTNMLHWNEMISNGRFSCVSRLRYKVASHELRLLKPDPAFFRLFDRELATRPGNVYFFDDHEGNALAAQRHGWRAHFVDHEGDPIADIRNTLAAEGLLASSAA